MAYKPGKPVATDDLSVSQTDLLGNFAAIRTVSDPDHGMALFPRQVAVPVTAATTVGLISQDSITSPGTTALKFAPQAGGATIDFTSSLNANPGWFRLPCGILMKWGNFALVGGANYTSHDAFPVAANTPVFAAVYSAQVTPRPTGGAGDHYAIYLSAITVTHIDVKHDSAVGRSYDYLVIGI